MDVNSIIDKNFVYHEISTDTKSFLSDIGRLLALGTESQEIRDENNIVVKSAEPIVDRCWTVVYPTITDRTLFPEVLDWDNLLPSEYKKITEYQLGLVKDTVILKTTTLPKNVTISGSTGLGVNKDLEQKDLTMYLEIYKPPYLCDSESDDPLLQRDGYVPKVLDISGIREDSRPTRVARNYHHVFMRIFDNIKPDMSGPIDNVYDPVTRDVLEWKSRSSNWSKLSWYTDFENKFLSSLVDRREKGMQMGTVRVPVFSGLSSETKIKLWANINRNRVVLGCMGSPNVDFSDNRHLISACYIGQIESFDFSLNDTAGNFGLFTTSSTSPAVGKTEIRTRPSTPARWNGVTLEDASNADNRSITSIKTISVINPDTYLEFTFPSLPGGQYDQTKPDGGDRWGDRYIDPNNVTINLYLYCNKVYYMKDGKQIGEDVTNPNYKFDVPVIVDPEDKKNVKMKLPMNDIIKNVLGSVAAERVLSGTDIRFYHTNGYGWTSIEVRYSFNYYTEYVVQVGGVKRDKFGNPISSQYDNTYGKNTATGITDFAMYSTFSKDYYQKHYFRFASTDEFMQKEMYGKSVYTGEYSADRIKIVHSVEGERGILSGLITIDPSSLFEKDELIVNKDFVKYIDKPEELYIHLPITAPYCPFSNSPNGRHSIGILKDIRYPVPKTDDEIVAFSVRELDKKYSTIGVSVSDFPLVSTTSYGAKVTWTSSDETIIKIEEVIV